MNVLVLFDIDGTLLSSTGAGTRAMDLAFEKHWGIKDAFQDINMAGRTDPWIFRQGFDRHALKEDFSSALGKFSDAYHAILPEVLAAGRVILKPGLPALLDRLKTLPDTGLGLLTGNFEGGAFAKLRAAGIAQYFTLGAFGSDDEDRNCLLPHALKRFAAKGTTFTAERTVVIGDTPRDIACARAHGAKAVAVATGGHRVEDLKPHEPDLLLNNLANHETLWQWLEKMRKGG